MRRDGHYAEADFRVGQPRIHKPLDGNHSLSCGVTAINPRKGGAGLSKLLTCRPRVERWATQLLRARQGTSRPLRFDGTCARTLLETAGRSPQGRCSLRLMN